MHGYRLSALVRYNLNKRLNDVDLQNFNHGYLHRNTRSFDAASVGFVLNTRLCAECPILHARFVWRWALEVFGLRCILYSPQVVVHVCHCVAGTSGQAWARTSAHTLFFMAPCRSAHFCEDTTYLLNDVPTHESTVHSSCKGPNIAT